MAKDIFEELAEAQEEKRQPRCPRCQEPLIIEEMQYKVHVWRWDVEAHRYYHDIFDEGTERPCCFKCGMEFGRFWIGSTRGLRELGIDY